MEKRISILLTLALALAVVIGMPPQTSTADDLPTMQNVQITDGILTWDSFPGAERYYVRIHPNSAWQSTSDTSFDLKEQCTESGLESGPHKVYLKAAKYENHESVILSSEWEGSYTYTAAPKLSTPAGFSWDLRNQTISWNPVANATSYSIVVYIDNYPSRVWGDSTNARFNISNYVGNGEHTYKVKVTAKADDYRPSDQGESSTVTFTIRRTIKNVTINDGILTWDPLVGAKWYYLTVITPSKSETIYGTSQDLVQLFHFTVFLAAHIA